MFGRKKEEKPVDRRDQVLKLLKEIRLPDGSDPVTAQLVKNLTTSEDAVAFTLEVSARHGDLKGSAESLLKKLDWVKALHINVEAAAAEAPGAGGLRHILAVASGKGGVGKSTVATNLAFALKKRGFKVGLMDADIYGPSVPHMLGLKHSKPVIDTVGGRQRILPVEHDGIRAMSMGFMVEVEKPVIWRGPMVAQAVKQFFTEVAWGDLDFLVIDLPPGTGDAQLTMVQQMAITGAVVVTTPQDVAMIDARKAFNMFRDTNVPVLGIVENMSSFICPNCGSHSEIFGKDGAKAWAKEAGVEFLGAIPLHLRIREQGDAGVPAVAAPKAEKDVVEAFTAVADAVVRQVEKLKPRTKGLSLSNENAVRFDV